MNFFRLRNLAGNQWPPLPDEQVARVWAAYLTLDRTQWSAPEQTARDQLSQFRTLASHCLTYSPAIARRLRAAGITSEDIPSQETFRRIPIMSREEFQKEFDDVVCREVPDGTTVLDEDSTSGTTGVPVRILKTNIFYIWWLAFYLRDLKWSGIDPRGRLAVIRATSRTGPALDRLMQGEEFPAWNSLLEPLLEMGPMFGMDLRQDANLQLNWLEKTKPEYLLSHASNLSLLAGLVMEKPRHFSGLKAIQSISETMYDEERDRISKAFGAPVKNLYSCAEAGYLASPCPGGPGLHVHAENAIIEVLDDADQPCRPGETGRVVLTTLHNFKTPFIRYDIGDRVTLAAEPCPCGRGLPTLTRVLGKQRPVFPLPNGRRKHSSGLVHAISVIGGHRQHQAEQLAPDHVIVRIVPDSGWTNEHPERLRVAVREFFEDDVRVDILITDRLAPSASGKLQSMIPWSGDRDSKDSLCLPPKQSGPVGGIEID